MVVHFVVVVNIVVILSDGFYVVISILVESTKGVVFINLIVKTESSFKVRIACCRMLIVVNYPKRIGKDCLLKLTVAPSFVIGPEEVGKEFQSTCSVSQINTLIICITTSLTTPRGQFYTKALSCCPLGTDDDNGIDCGIITCTWILYDFDATDVV